MLNQCLYRMVNKNSEVIFRHLQLRYRSSTVSDGYAIGKFILYITVYSYATAFKYYTILRVNR